MAGQPVEAELPGGGNGAESGDDTVPSRVLAARELASASLSVAEPPALLLRDHSPALEFLKDESGRLVYYNRAFANIFAVEGESLLRKRDHEWLPAANAERVRRHDEMVLATGAVLEIEETLPGPAGPRHWLVLRFPLQGESGVRLVGAVAVDISDRRRRESTLHRMAAILESSHDAVISATPDGYVTSWNTGATQMYGYSAAEMEGQQVSLLEPEERTGEIGQVLERIRAGERVVRYETIRRHKNGRALEVAVSVSPIRDENGELAGIASITRDIADTKRAQEMIAFQSFHDSLTGLSNRALLMTDTYLARSLDGGTTFTNTRVSNESSNEHDCDGVFPCIGINYGNQQGDYEGLVTYGGVAHPIWTDSRRQLDASPGCPRNLKMEEVFTAAVK